MKKYYQIFASFILLFFMSSHSVNACTVVAEPLRKTFRRSKAVFLAEVKDIKVKPNSDYSKSLIDGEITFDISKFWKGNYENQIILSANIG